MGSTAMIDNASCRWIDDPTYGSWCEWNLTYGPVGSGEEGIIDNIWLGADNMTPDYNAVADYEGWSGNSGSGVTAGNYYLLVEMGDTSINIYVDGAFFETINNSGKWWRDLSSVQAYTFDNGTHQIDVDDTEGPDMLNWSITVGGPSAVCGNDATETGETCDGTDLGGQTCVDLGYDGGTLSCLTDCSSYNDSLCTMDSPSATNLSVSKEALADPVTVGEVMAYRLIVNNTGDTDLTALRVFDFFNDSFMTYVSSDTATFAEGTDSVSWQFGLDSGQSVEIMANFTADAAGLAQNSLEVWNATDMLAGAGTGVLINEAAGLDVVALKTALTPSVQVGMETSFSLNVTNNEAGPVDIVFEDIYDKMMLNFSWASVPPDELDYNTGYVSWNVTVASGTTESIIANFTALMAGVAGNELTAQNATMEFDSSNASVNINPPPGVIDFHLNKTLLNGSVSLGQIAHFRLNVTNNGTQDAIGFSIADEYDKMHLNYT